jgi:hypothetical protein
MELKNFHFSILILILFFTILIPFTKANEEFVFIDGGAVYSRLGEKNKILLTNDSIYFPSDYNGDGQTGIMHMIRDKSHYREGTKVVINLNLNESSNTPIIFFEDYSFKIKNLEDFEEAKPVSNLLGIETNSIIIYPNQNVIINQEHTGGNSRNPVFYATLYNPTTDSTFGFPSDPKNHTAFLEYTVTITHDPWNDVKIGIIVGISLFTVIGVLCIIIYKKRQR